MLLEKLMKILKKFETLKMIILMMRKEAVFSNCNEIQMLPVFVTF